MEDGHHPVDSDDLRPELDGGVRLMFEDVGVVVRVLGARGGEQRCPEWLAWGAGCKWYSVWSVRFLSRQPSRGNNTWDTIQKVGKALVFERSVGDVFT